MTLANGTGSCILNLSSMDNFDIINLIRTRDGLINLQSSLNENGIQLDLHRSEFGYYNLDFGLNCIEDLEYECEVPVGYEETETANDRKKLRKTFKLTNHSNNIININSIDILPNNSKSLPLMSVYINEIDIRFAIGKKSIKVHPQEEISICVEFLLLRDFNGFLGRWLIFLFEIKNYLSPTYCQTLSFVYGLRVLGCVTQKTSSRMKLSSEARVFIPQSILTYFDKPVSCIILKCAYIHSFKS